MAEKRSCDDVLNNIESVLAHPGLFLSPLEEHTDTAKVLCKQLYGLTQNIDKKTKHNHKVPVLDELYIDKFDSEQIWQQLDHKFSVLTNESYISTLSSIVTSKNLGLNISKSYSKIPQEAASENESVDSEAVDDEDDESHPDSEEFGDYSDEEEVRSESLEDDEAYTEDTQAKQKSKSRVDDKFFSMKAMESFLDQQDLLLEKDPVKFNRQFDELYESDADEDEEYKYEDLFGSDSSKSANNKQKQKRNVKFLDEEEYNEENDGEEDDESDGGDVLKDEDNEEELSDEDLELMNALEKDGQVSEEEQGSDNEDEELSGSEEEEESDAENLEDVIGRQKHEPLQSEFEKRNEKLKARINALEQEALSDKPWQLMGEVTAKTRPENSLIQEDVEFESNVAPIPVITMETTLNLEQLIKQRIKDKAYDDVQRKTRLRDDSDKFKKRIDLDQAKSKLSLSQIYEQEYLNLRDKDEEKDENEEEAEEKEIKSLMKSLFSKLDALSSYQFTPKPVPPEVKVISHLPAVVVEEVQPTTMADADRLAPEELKKPKVEFKVRSEMDQTDKKRIRRQVKAKARKNEKFKKSIERRVQKINPGLGNKRAEQRTIAAIKEAVVNEGKIIKPTKESVIPSKSYSSSKEFFKALQNEVKLDKQVTRKKAESKKWVTNKSSVPAERFKL